jgi:hypothetical protein
VLGEFDSGEFLSLNFSCSFYFGFELILTLLCHFAWFTVFVPVIGFVAFPSSR